MIDKDTPNNFAMFAQPIQSSTSSLLNKIRSKNEADRNEISNLEYGTKVNPGVQSNGLQVNNSTPLSDSKPTISSTVLNGVKTYDIPELYHGTQTPDRIVTHRTAGHGFHTPTDPRALKQGLGAHYTVDRSGTIHQIGTPETKMWHAGPKGNTNSIGIEATGKYINGAWEPLTDKQIAALTQLYSNLRSKYKINGASPHYTLAAKTGNEGQQLADLYNKLY